MVKPSRAKVRRPRGETLGTLVALDRNGIVKVIGTDKHNGHVEMQSGS